jgi:hypothetical protein
MQVLRYFPYTEAGRHRHPEPPALTAEDHRQWPDAAPITRHFPPRRGLPGSVSASGGSGRFDANLLLDRMI